MGPGHIGEGGWAHGFLTNTHPIPVNCSGRRCESRGVKVEIWEADFLSVAEVGWFSMDRAASEMTLAGETEWTGRTAPTEGGGCF